jgi:hypothetical protein
VTRHKLRGIPHSFTPGPFHVHEIGTFVQELGIIMNFENFHYYSPIEWAFTYNTIFQIFLKCLYILENYGQNSIRHNQIEDPNHT